MNGCKPFCCTTPGEISESVSVLQPHPRPGKSQSPRVGPKPSRALQMAVVWQRGWAPVTGVWCVSSFFQHKNIWELVVDINAWVLLLEFWFFDSGMGGAYEFVFLTSSQVILMQVVQVSHFETNIICFQISGQNWSSTRCLDWKVAPSSWFFRWCLALLLWFA